MTSAPPLQNFNKILSNTVLRGSSSDKIQVSSLVAIDFTKSNLFADYSSLAAAYKECKIKKVCVWVSTNLSATSPGLWTSIVAPVDEINGKDTYSMLSASPGSYTRKIFQPLHGVYYPTEPAERNWFDTKSKDYLFTLQVMTSEMPPNNSIKYDPIYIQVIWDAHILFRGRRTQTPQVSALEDFEITPAVDHNDKFTPTPSVLGDAVTRIRL